MKKFVGAATFALAAIISVAALAADDGLPDWAYPINPPPPAGAAKTAPDMTPLHVPNSTVALTAAQTRDLFNPPDWHPADHPPLPDVVAHGRKPGVFACSFCHLPNGLGRPENASLAGLSPAYIVQQVQDLKSGARRSAKVGMVPPTMMTGVAKSVNDDELQAAAAYFSSLKLTPWVRVVEAGMVPKTHVAGAMYVVTEGEGSGMEPIGKRIVEVPVNTPQTELRDSESGFVAYVPVGSIKKGERLVTTGGGKTLQCAVCHGADLKGLGPVPPLAGRSPTYLMRQLYDIQRGTRAGTWSPLMKQVVAKLDDDDLLNIIAYVSSRTP